MKKDKFIVTENVSLGFMYENKDYILKINVREGLLILMDANDKESMKVISLGGDIPHPYVNEIKEVENAENGKDIERNENNDSGKPSSRP